MNRYLRLINNQLKGKYMTIADDYGHMIEGIYERGEWHLSSLTQQNEDSEEVQIKCFVKPKYDEDAERFNADAETGLICDVFDVKTVQFILLDSNGNIIKKIH